MLNKLLNILKHNLIPHVLHAVLVVVCLLGVGVLNLPVLSGPVGMLVGALVADVLRVHVLHRVLPMLKQ